MNFFSGKRAARLLALVLSLMVAVSIWWPRPAAADGKPLEIITWAPASGPSALWYDALEGLKASAAMFNAHGGIGGRPLKIISPETDDLSPDFLPNLTAALARRGAAAAVGGPVSLRGAETADLFRSLEKVWLGPWSNDGGMYRGEKSDPFATLPPWNLELKALLAYIKKAYAAAPSAPGPVFLVYYNLPADQAMAAEARAMAEKMGLELRRAPVNVDFINWPYLAKHVSEGGAVIIWLHHGPAAAFVKAARRHRPEAMFLTNSLNATNRNLVLISGGAWNGMIFPAVLRPSREIPEAFEAIFRRYGPKGLEPGYQAYLGFAQGQVLARALSLGGGQSLNMAQRLYDMAGFSTLLYAPVNYKPGRHVPPDLFYLGQAYGSGHWDQAPAPESFFAPPKDK